MSHHAGHPEMFYKKHVLKSIKIHKKTSEPQSFFDKEGLKRGVKAGVFSEFSKIV